jgi:alpha-beta hydrolase superfamily lysophospholipase
LARALAVAGYAVYGMDYPGFGLSEGLHGYIPNFDTIVDDVIEQYRSIKGEFSFVFPITHHLVQCIRCEIVTILDKTVVSIAQSFSMICFRSILARLGIVIVMPI